MGELQNRRDRLFAKMKENSCAIIFAGVPKLLSEDACYDFHVNKNFFYLTNIKQEGSVLILVKGIGVRYTYLFIRENDPIKEKWTGHLLTIEEAVRDSKIDSTFRLASFENMLQMVLTPVNNSYGKIDKVYIDLSPELKIKDAYSTSNFKDYIEAEYPHCVVEDVYPFIRDLRMIKSAEEVENIVRAINVTNSGINYLINNLKPNVLEYSIADEFEFYGRKNGRHALSFPTIVASGKNACCLHYPTQLDAVGPNDLILFDLGYENDGYCADISRTYPISGVYTGKQRDIYEAVLNTNKAVINHIRSGMTIKELNEFATESLRSECIRLGLIDENYDMRKIYFHNVSHHLGLDTHDISDRSKPLENGNVITVEPGLYFSDLGIGVRIEDDVLISNDRAVVLSKNVAKEISDVERLFKTRTIR